MSTSGQRIPNITLLQLGSNVETVVSQAMAPKHHPVSGRSSALHSRKRAENVTKQDTLLNCAKGVVKNNQTGVITIVITNLLTIVMRRLAPSATCAVLIL